MGKHYKNPVFAAVSEQVAEAVAVELQEQPWWLRYKGSIMLVLQAVACPVNSARSSALLPLKALMSTLYPAT